MQTKLEEIFNATSHGIGTLLSIAGLVIMVVLAAHLGHTTTVVSCSIYGASLIFLYAASTLYHSAVDPNLKKTLKIIDHSSIFFLILVS